MTAFIVAAYITVGVLGIGAVWLILRREDARPLSVPGRDAPESPAATGPPGSDPQWWLKGGPGIPAGGSTVRPPSLHEGFMAALAMNKRAEDRNAGLLPAAPDSPAGEVGTGGKRAADPVTPATKGDDVPGPASLPEGDEPAARPPQEAPAREPSPLAKAIAANAALQAIPLGDYLSEVDAATAYDGDAPWNPFSDVTLTRLRAIKDEVA